MKTTTKVYSEFNNLLLGQYKDKPEVKAAYYLTYGGELPQMLFKEYFDKIRIATNDIRSEVLMLETPSKTPLFNILLDLVSDNITLLEQEKNEHAEYQKHLSIELLRWLKTRLPKGNITIKKDVRTDYFRELKGYFEPQEQFRNFVMNKAFTTIYFNGTQGQLAYIFKHIDKNKDLIKSNWEDAAKYISDNFIAKGKPVNQNTIRGYFNGKKTMSPKNEIEINI